MARPQGTYAKVYESLADHPKTLALAGRLSNVLGLSADMSVPFVFMGVSKLACYCIREQESGELGHLTASKFCNALGLPWGAADAKEVHEAWKESGFLDVAGDSIKLHEFGDYASSLLRDRQRKRDKRAEDPSADNPETVRGQSRDRARVPEDRKTEDGRRKSSSPKSPSKETVLTLEDEADAAALLAAWTHTFGKPGQTYSLTGPIRRAYAKARAEGYLFTDMRTVVHNAGKDEWARGNNHQLPWLIRIGRDRQGNPVDNVQKYRDWEAPVTKHVPIKYTPLQESAIRRARKKYDAGDLENAERVLAEQGLSIEGLREEGRRRAGLNGNGTELEAI